MLVQWSRFAVQNIAVQLALGIAIVHCSISGQSSSQLRCLELLAVEGSQIIPPDLKNPLFKKMLKELNSELRNPSDPKHSGLVAEFDSKFRTVRIRSRNGRVSKSAAMRVLALPGQGANISRVRGLIELLGVLNYRGDFKGKNLKGTLKKFMDDPLYIELSAEGIGLPGEMGVLSMDSFGGSATWYLNWLERYVFDMLQETPDKPILLIPRSAHSANAHLVAQAVNDKLVADGQAPMIHVLSFGTMVPHPRAVGANRKQLLNFVDFLVKSNTHKKTKDKNGRWVWQPKDPESLNPNKFFIPYYKVIEDVYSMMRQMDWSRVASDISGGKHIAVVAREDTQVIRTEREILAETEANNAGNFMYIDIPGIDTHDFFKRSEKVNSEKQWAFRLILLFADIIINKRDLSLLEPARQEALELYPKKK